MALSHARSVARPSAAPRAAAALLLLLTTLVQTACDDPPSVPAGGGAGGAAPGSAPTATAATGAEDDWFVERAEATGLRFSYFNGLSGEFYFPEMLPGGVGLLDYDRDGDLDVYLAQGRMLRDGASPDEALLPPPAGPLRGTLYRNDLAHDGDGAPTLRFTDVTEESGIDARAYGMGVAVGDIDNDGWPDLYLTNLGENRLYRNRGDGTFEDVSEASGTADAGWGVSAAFLDYDGDGLLDLYVGNYVQYDVEADRPCTGLTGRRDYCTPEVYPAQADRLYRNLGDGGFRDVTATALAGGPFGPALGVSAADVDGDGWTDIYVANDGAENLLWMNRRDGTLENRGLLSGTALSGSGRAEASMGVDAGDADNDGDQDLFMTHLPAEGNNLYVNQGDGLFEDRSAPSGLGPGSLGHSGFGTAWLDYDNDGWLDLLVVNGAIEAVRDRQTETFAYDEPNLLFRNDGNGRFTDVTPEAGRVFARSEVSRGAAFGDIDNDGDTDVVVSNLNAPARLLLNQVGNRRHWLGLALTRPDGRPVVGARVTVTTGDGRTLVRRARADGSYASANDPRVLVGLGDDGGAVRVRVQWPGGGTDEWDALAVDRWTTLVEGGQPR